MKKFLFTILVLGIIFTTTGCVKYDYNIEVSKKGEISVKQTHCIKKDAVKSKYIMKKITDKFLENAKVLEKNGYKTGAYTDNEYKGYKISRDFALLSDFKKEDLPKGFSTTQKSPIIVKDENFAMKKYIINLDYDINVASDNFKNSDIYKTFSETFTSEEYTGDNSNARATLTIKVPYRASKHNANKLLDNNTYEWDLSKTGKQTVLIEYNVIQFSVLGIIFSLILTLVAVGFLWVKLKNDNIV